MFQPYRVLVSILLAVYQRGGSLGLLASSCKATDTASSHLTKGAASGSFLFICYIYFVHCSETTSRFSLHSSILNIVDDLLL